MARTPAERKAEAARAQQITEQATARQQSKNLNKVVDLLRQADALLQKTIPHSDELYYIHTQIENAADDVVDMIVAVDDGQTV